MATGSLRLIDLRRMAIVGAACALTVGIGMWLVLKSHYYGVPLALVPVVLPIPVWLATTRRTGVALAAVLVYLGLLDGVIKLRSGGQAATLGRDVVLYAVAAGMVARGGGRARLPPLGGWVLAWSAVVVVQLANPGNYSMAHAVASLRQDLEFVPLFFIGFSALRTRTSLHAFFAILLAAAAINGAVAAYQGSLSPAQLAAWGPGYANLIDNAGAGRTFIGATGKLQVRPPALGSDEGFGGVLGATALPGGIALLLAYRRRRWLLAPIALGIVGAAVAVLTSQSRTDVLTAIAGLVAMIGLLAVGRQAKRALLGVCLGACVAVIAVQAMGSFTSSGLYRYRSIAPGSAASTIYSSRATTWSTIPAYIAHLPLGAGLGKVGPAASKAGATATMFNYNAETEFNFLIVETGIPGLVVFLAFNAVLCTVTLRGLRRERDRQTIVLMAALAAPLVGYAATWFVGITTTTPPTAPYFWLTAGAISWHLVARHAEAGSAPAPLPARTAGTLT